MFNKKPNIQGGSESAGIVDVGNSTRNPLDSNESFLGEWFDALDYSMMTLLVNADQDIAPDGLKMQVSNDGISVDIEKKQEQLRQVQIRTENALLLQKKKASAELLRNNKEKRD